MEEIIREKDVAYAFAKKISETKYSDLPQETVSTAKKSIMDTIGVMVGASGMTPSLCAFVDLANEMGGKEDSTVIGFGGKVPAPTAAFVNGAMVHSLDYDDVVYEGMFHPSGAVIAAALAIAEKNRPIGGKEFITAVALGQDLAVRLGVSIPSQRKPPWHRTPLLGTFAAAATAAKLLNLDEDGIVDSLGIALCQAAGTMEMRWGVGTDLGILYFAFPSKAGVLSALLAEKGLVGIKTCFEGKAGFFNLYFEGKYDRELLVSDLFDRFLSNKIALKPWPSCLEAHTCIDATLRLVKAHKIKPEEVERIVVYYGDVTKALCEPLAERQQPQTANDAKYSIPYCVATALVTGNIILDDFTDSSLRDPKILEITEKVEPRFDPKLNVVRELPPGAVEITTKQGHTYRCEVTRPYGHPENPISWEAAKEKFKDCFSLSLRPLPEQNMTKVMEMIENLEEVNDLSGLMALLS